MGTPSPANVLIFISFIMPISVFSIRTHTPGLFKGVCRVSYKALLIVYFIYLFNIYHLHNNCHLRSSRYFTQTSAAGPLHGPEGWKPRSPLTGEGCAPGKHKEPLARPQNDSWTPFLSPVPSLRASWCALCHSAHDHKVITAIKSSARQAELRREKHPEETHLIHNSLESFKKLKSVMHLLMGTSSVCSTGRYRNGKGPVFPYHSPLA